MLSYVLFWTVAAVFVVGQALLIVAAWRLHRSAAELPAGVPRSDGRSDLGWTVMTALLTGVMFYFVYLGLS